MAAKKITRKQLLKEPDEFLTFTARALQFATKHKFKLMVGLGVCCAIVILISGFMYFSARSEEKAFTLMEQGIDRYKTLAQSVGPVKACQSVAPDFEIILKKYPDKTGGKLARVTYADICYKAGEYDKAVSLYTQSLKDFGNQEPVRYLVLSGLGYSYAAEKNYPEAAKYFEMVASSPDNIMTDEALFNLGRLYADMGKKDKSKESYQKIVSDHPQSIYGELAKEKLAG